MHILFMVLMLLPISRQLLIEYGGSDNESIKAFFTLYTDIQASATCLVLACSKAIQDQQIAEWATRAFLLYGGEPKLLFPPQQQQHINRGAGLPQGMQVGMSVAPNMMNAMQLHAPGAPMNSMHPQGSFHHNIASTPAQRLPSPHVQFIREQSRPRFVLFVLLQQSQACKVMGCFG